VLLHSVCNAETQSDFDSDGTSDIFYTTSSGSTLFWKAKGSTVVEPLSQLFGLTTDFTAPACWQTSDETLLSVVRLDSSKRNLVWKLLQGDGFINQKVFGRANDVVISGGDFDGDGIADAAVVRFSKKRLRWTVTRNFFTDNPSKAKSYSVGNIGDRAFFFNYDGTLDWLASFGLRGKRKARMVAKNIITGRSVTIRGFPKSLARGVRPRPFPIAQASGVDLIGFVTNDETDTTVLVYDNTAQKVAEKTFPGLGTVFVGEYLSGESGEEVGFQSGLDITYFNPVSKVTSKVGAVSGTPLDLINIGAINGPTPTPTTIPTSTPTATPTPT